MRLKAVQRTLQLLVPVYRCFQAAHIKDPQNYKPAVFEDCLDECLTASLKVGMPIISRFLSRRGMSHVQEANAAFMVEYGTALNSITNLNEMLPVAPVPNYAAWVRSVSYLSGDAASFGYLFLHMPMLEHKFEQHAEDHDGDERPDGERIKKLQDETGVPAEQFAMILEGLHEVVTLQLDPTPDESHAVFEQSENEEGTDPEDEVLQWKQTLTESTKLAVGKALVSSLQSLTCYGTTGPT